MIKLVLILFLTIKVAFAIDLQTLQTKSDSKDTKFITKLIKNAEVYEDISKIPDEMSLGYTLITEDDYGVKNFYILGDKNQLDEFSHPFFNEILNGQSGSTFNNLFVPSGSMGKSYDYTSDSSNDSFKPYVSDTASVRIGVLKVPNEFEEMEKALNDYLLNNTIYPQSIINIEMKIEKKIKTLWIFYRP